MSTNRKNELSGLDKEVYQHVWEFRGTPTLSSISGGLMLVSDGEFINLVASIGNLLGRDYIKSEIPDLKELQAKLHIYDDYTEAIMMLTRYSIK